MQQPFNSEDTGWVKIHRRLLRNPRYRDAEWVAVWLYLLLNATHAPIRKVFNGKVVELKPGQLVTGRNVISKATNVHRSKVERILNMLKIEQQIEQQTGNKGSMITVLNWAAYQNSSNQPSSDRAAAEQQPSTLQEGEELKKEVESTTPPLFAERPGWEEVKFFADKIGLAEWRARDWFDEMEGCGWLDHLKRAVQRWQSILMRVKTKWETDGRPSGPPRKAGGRGDSKPGTGNF